MKLMIIKIFSIIALLVTSTSILAASILPKGAIKSGINYNVGNSEYKNGINIEAQSIEARLSAGILNNLQLSFLYNGFNPYSCKAESIFNNLGKINIKSIIFSKENYQNSVNLTFPIRIFSKQKNKNYIIINHAHSYAFNNGIKLIVFHKNFINLKFLEDSNEITITAPITIGFPITDHLSATINTNLGSWTANTKKANISHSIINKIPTTLGFTYNINQSIDINANVGVVTYFNKKFNKKVTNSFNFGIGISYTSNVI